MATPYNSENTNGTLSLPRVHIPSWFKVEETSSSGDALLNLNLLTDLNNIPIYDATNILDSEDFAETKILDLEGENQINDTTNNIYKDEIFIGNVPPRQGKIIAYSNANGTFLNGTQSAHVLYFEHAALNKFNFAVAENHVIARIRKLYRSLISAKTGATTLTSIVNSDIENSTTYKMIINESDATVASNTNMLILVEGGH